MRGWQGGFSPLMYAIGNAAKDKDVLAILTKCPSAATQPNKAGSMALHVAMAATQLSDATVAALLTANPAAARHANARSALPLHIACERGASDAVIAALIAEYPEAVRGPRHVTRPWAHGARTRTPQ